MSDTLSTGQPKISGYRNLDHREVELINRIKAHGIETLELIDLITHSEPPLGREQEHARWVNIARTKLQLGFMALTRAVALPEGF